VYVYQSLSGKGEKGELIQIALRRTLQVTYTHFTGIKRCNKVFYGTTMSSNAQGCGLITFKTMNLIRFRLWFTALADGLNWAIRLDCK